LQADDELDEPYFKGFEWDKETDFTKFVIHLQKEAGPAPSKKKKGKKDDE
jgi:hypothetical protein